MQKRHSSIKTKAMITSRVASWNFLILIMICVNYSSFKIQFLYIFDTSPLLLIHVKDFCPPYQIFILSFDDYKVFLLKYNVFLLIFENFIMYTICFDYVHSSSLQLLPDLLFILQTPLSNLCTLLFV